MNYCNLEEIFYGKNVKKLSGGYTFQVVYDVSYIFVESFTENSSGGDDDLVGKAVGKSIKFYFSYCYIAGNGDCY